MNRPFTVAIVGTGFLARTRVRCWRRVHGSNVTIVTVSREKDRAEEFAREHGAHRAATFDEVLADKDVALVDLCVSNHAHAPLCERSAEAKKHVLCTKPMVKSLAEHRILRGIPNGAVAH